MNGLEVLKEQSALPLNLLSDGMSTIRVGTIASTLFDQDAGAARKAK